MGKRDPTRGVIAASLCSIALCLASHGPAAAQAPATQLSEQVALSVRACDAIITGVAIDEAANTAGMAPLSRSSRMADTDLAASSDTRIASFFGADTQVRSTAWENAQGFIWLIVAADGSKCQVMALGTGDLVGGGANGLATGSRGWQHVDGTQMRRANGDLVQSETLTTSGSRQIVFVSFTRGAPLTGLAERFRVAAAACDAMIGGSSIDDTARVAGLTLSESARATATPPGADPATAVATFFGTDSQIRHVHEQHAGGFFAFIVAADGSKCEALGVGQADLSRGAAEGLAANARGWSRVGTGRQQRANGDEVSIEQTVNANGVQIVQLLFLHGRR